MSHSGRKCPFPPVWLPFNQAGLDQPAGVASVCLAFCTTCSMEPTNQTTEFVGILLGIYADSWSFFPVCCKILLIRLDCRVHFSLLPTLDFELFRCVTALLLLVCVCVVLLVLWCSLCVSVMVFCLCCARFLVFFSAGCSWVCQLCDV